MKEIKDSLHIWNTAFANGDSDSLSGLFDTNAKVILVGSEKNEVHIGHEHIQTFFKNYFKQTFRLSWDMERIHVDHHDNTAWAFVDGFVLKKNKDATVQKIPYRFTVVMVKIDGTWKWRLFNGSVPEVEAW